MIFDSVECEAHNLDHACRRLSAIEIEQVIWNATTYQPHRRYPDRVLFTAATDGGKRATVVARYDPGRAIVRPITPWEES